MKIAFAGTTTNAVDVLRYLVQSGRYEICCVITREDAPVGRKQTLSESPVAEFATSVGLKAIKANRVTAEVNRQVEQLRPDLGLVIAYGALLKAETLSLPTHGWVNIHYSLLPKWRGAAPVQRALMAGERETGVTIFQLDEGMDTGLVHAQVAATIEPVDNSKTLLERLTRIAISMLDEVLAKIDAGLSLPTAQIGEASHAAKISRADTRIDWAQSAVSIENLVRGANPEPIAWTELNNQAFRVINARYAPEVESSLGETLVGQAVLIQNRAFVRTANGALELIEVQPASKNSMPAADWLRGKNGDVIFS